VPCERNSHRQSPGDGEGLGRGGTWAAFDAFTGNVQAALAHAAGSNDPAIVALDKTVKEEMAKLSAEAATVAGTAGLPAPVPVPATA
jgi:hypothetical protein